MTTEKPCRLLVITHLDFHAYDLEEFPDVQSQVLNALARRVRRHEPDQPHEIRTHPGRHPLHRYGTLRAARESMKKIEMTRLTTLTTLIETNRTDAHLPPPDRSATRPCRLLQSSRRGGGAPVPTGSPCDSATSRNVTHATAIVGVENGIFQDKLGFDVTPT